MERLTNFLSPSDQASGCEAKPELDQIAALPSAETFSCRIDKDMPAVSMRDTRRKLMEEPYKLSDRLISSSLMTLIKAIIEVMRPSLPRIWSAWWRTCGQWW